MCVIETYSFINGDLTITCIYSSDRAQSEAWKSDRTLPILT